MVVILLHREAFAGGAEESAFAASCRVFMGAVVTALVSVDDTVTILAAFVSVTIRLLGRVGIGGRNGDGGGAIPFLGDGGGSISEGLLRC